MDDLAIKIAITYKVPKRGLTLNGLLRGLERDRDSIMRAVLGTILSALEEDSLKALPEGWIRNGHQSRPRTFKTSFGVVRHRMAQVRDRKGAIRHPLERRLRIVPYRQYQGQELEAAVGQAIHLSYRVAARETLRLKGAGPSKSTLWRRLQDLAETAGAWPPLKDRPFRFLMVDGTKVRLQEGGFSLGKAEMRWAMAAEEISKPFELIGFWVNKDWAAIRRDLDLRLNYRRLRVLFSDGGPGIEEAFLAPGMELQRCILHGQRDFSFLLYADGIKGQAQKRFRDLLGQNPLFRLRQASLETLEPSDEPLVRKLARSIRRGFSELLAALPSEKYPKTRTYVRNFAAQALVFFDYWLDHRRWLPLTTNTIESAFSRAVNRIKRIGRRWSEDGLLNWLMLAFRKIFQPKLWESLWAQYLGRHHRLRLVSLCVEHEWTYAIT